MKLAHAVRRAGRWAGPLLVAQLLGMRGAADALAQTPPAPERTPAAAQAGNAQVPRFASLKSDRVHLRQGPGTDHRVLWIYRRAGLPVEIIREFEGWRQVRDAEGATGWVAHTLISGRRTAVVLPWEAKGEPLPQVALLADDRESAAKVVMVEAGVIANVRTCDGRWCYVSVGEWRGYIEQKKLWGVYANEVVK